MKTQVAMFAGLVLTAFSGSALAVPPVKDPCPPGQVWSPKLKTCLQAVRAEPALPKNDPETGPKGPGAGGPHPIDPLPPKPRHVGGAVELPVRPHMPRDPGDGSGQQPVDPRGTAVPVPIKPRPIAEPVKNSPIDKAKPVPIEDCRKAKPVPTC
jgi:hypothetical protein